MTPDLSYAATADEGKSSASKINGTRKKVIQNDNSFSGKLYNTNK